MLILGISGSPAKDGVTSLLLDNALLGARSKLAETEKVILNDLYFRPCQQCGGCDRTGICVLKDDLSFLYDRIEVADAVIVSSPIFFGSVSAQIKMMIDRFQCAWIRRNMADNPVGAKSRRGIFLCAAGSERTDFFENARKTIRIFYATLNIEYYGELFVPSADGKKISGELEYSLKRAFELGVAICR